MADIDFNSNLNNSFVPKYLKQTDINSVQQSDVLIQNQSNELCFENENTKIFLKEPLSVKNYAQCFGLNGISLRIQGASTVNDINDLCNSGSIYYEDKYPIKLYLYNIWKACASIKTNEDKSTSYIINEDKSYIKMNDGYFCFSIPNDLDIRFLNYDSNDYNKRLKEGYISSINLNLNFSQDSEDILRKIYYDKISLDIYGNNSASELNNKIINKYHFNSISGNAIALYKFNLNGSTWYGEGDGYGYDIPFFAEKVYNECYLNINLSKKISDPKSSSTFLTNRVKIPVQLIIKNELIQILTAYTNLHWNTSVNQFCSKGKGDDWYSEFQVWCPDSTYLTMVVNQINIKADVTEGSSDNWKRKQFKYYKFTFNIADKKVGDFFNLTFIFTYSQGEIYYQKTYKIKITIEA